MMGPALIAMTLPQVALVVPTDPVRTPSVCWISDVVASGKGVRIYFSRSGGPLFVNLSNGIFRPSDAPIDPARPDEAAIDLGLGDLLYPTNSPEDGCTLVVVNRNGHIGVDASAYFHPIGLPSQSTSEFIAARN